MITKEQAFSIIRKEKPNHKITTSYEFPDKFAFVVMPKDADPDTFICTGTFVMKKDGHIEYGMPTVQEMEHAVAITEEKELKHEDLAPDELMHHGVRGMKWGKRNGPPYPLNEQGKADLRKQRMASYGKSVTKGGDYSGPSYDTVSVGSKKKGFIKRLQEKKAAQKQAQAEKEKTLSEDKAKKTEEEIKQRKEKAIRDGDVQEAFRNREHYTDAELTAVQTRYILNQNIASLVEADRQAGMNKVNDIAARLETVNRLTNAVAVGAANLAKIYNVAVPIVNQTKNRNLQQIPTGNLAQYQGGGGVPSGSSLFSKKKKKKKH